MQHPRAVPPRLKTNALLNLPLLAVPRDEWKEKKNTPALQKKNVRIVTTTGGGQALPSFILVRERDRAHSADGRHHSHGHAAPAAAMGRPLRGKQSRGA